MVQATLPAAFERPLPLATRFLIGHVNDDSYQVISGADATVAPGARALWSLVPGRADAIHARSDRLGEPCRQPLPPVIGRQGKPSRNAPLSATHRIATSPGRAYVAGAVALERETPTRRHDATNAPIRVGGSRCAL